MFILSPREREDKKSMYIYGMHENSSASLMYVCRYIVGVCAISLLFITTFFFVSICSLLIVLTTQVLLPFLIELSFAYRVGGRFYNEKVRHL